MMAACRARLSSCHARLERARARRAGGSWYPWYVVGVLTLFSVSGNIDQQILSLLIRPIERDFHISDSQFGYLGGVAFALFFAVLGLPIARLADRTSRRNVMVGGATLWSVFTSLCAGAKTFWQLFVLRMGVGVGEATLNAPAASLLADYFPRREVRRRDECSQRGHLHRLRRRLCHRRLYRRRDRQRTDATSSNPRRPSNRGNSCFSPWAFPGLLVALLLLTVREPRRQREGQEPAPSFSALMTHVAKHRRTFAYAGARVRDVVERELLAGRLDSGRLSSPIRLERSAGRAAPGAAHDFHRTDWVSSSAAGSRIVWRAQARPTRRFAWG